MMYICTYIAIIKQTKTINVSKIANTSTLDDNSTTAGCNSRLMIIHILGL